MLQQWREVGTGEWGKCLHALFGPEVTTHLHTLLANQGCWCIRATSLPQDECMHHWRHILFYMENILRECTQGYEDIRRLFLPAGSLKLLIFLTSFQRWRSTRQCREFYEHFNRTNVLYMDASQDVCIYYTIVVVRAINLGDLVLELKGGQRREIRLCTVSGTFAINGVLAFPLFAFVLGHNRHRPQTLMSPAQRDNAYYRFSNMITEATNSCWNMSSPVDLDCSFLELKEETYFSCCLLDPLWFSHSLAGSPLRLWAVRSPLSLFSLQPIFSLVSMFFPVRLLLREKSNGVCTEQFSYTRGGRAQEKKVDISELPCLQYPPPPNYEIWLNLSRRK